MPKDLVSKMSGAKMFAEIDLAHAFHQIPLHKDSQEITTFTDPETGKQMCFTVMIEGLKGAATHCQFILDRVSDWRSS